MIERHEGAHGYYWKSYDFASSVGRQNLFTFPLGPAPGPRTFQHDGGEIIFRLPNGLQAYMLVDSRGNRLDRGPTSIVSDPKHPDRVVENGISCMSCHARGMIEKEDQVRPHLENNLDAFPEREQDAIRAFYPPREKFAAVLKADAESFRSAVLKTGAKLSATEPIVVTSLRFESDLDLKQAAAEVWMTPEDLLKGMDEIRSLSRTLGALRTPGGTVQRQTFVRRFGDVIHRFKVAQFVEPLQRDD